MNPRTRTLLIILSVSLNVAFITAWGMKTLVRPAAAARQESRRCNADSCRIWCPLHRALQTTDEQWKVLEPMQRDFQSATRQLADSADELRSELAGLLAESVVNTPAVDAQQSRILAVQQQMQALVVKHLLEEKRVLTPAQQAKLFAMMRDHGGCAGHAGVMGGGGRVRCANDGIETEQK